MKPVLLARLSCAMVMARRFSASVAAGFDPDVRDVSCFECQHQLVLEENSAFGRSPAGVQSSPWGLLLWLRTACEGDKSCCGAAFRLLRGTSGARVAKGHVPPRPLSLTDVDEMVLSDPS